MRIRGEGIILCEVCQRPGKGVVMDLDILSKNGEVSRLWPDEPFMETSMCYICMEANPEIVKAYRQVKAKKEEVREPCIG